MPFICVDQQNLNYKVRRSQKVKRLQMRFMVDNFEIVAPLRLTNVAITQFIFEHRRWMHKQLLREQTKPSAPVQVVDVRDKALKAKYVHEANQIIEQILQAVCPRLGRWPTGVTLKQQKTRWGSCGIDDRIHINWLLVLAPPGVLEYVVIHELCHLFYRNHGPRFWAKVKSCMPDYEIHERWLRQHGRTLMTQ
jgi:predicted metal-dependent hydrolase